MKICHFSSVHPVQDNRIVKQCSTLVEAGHQVTLVVTSGDPDKENQVRAKGIQLRLVPRPEGRLERTFLTTWRVFRETLKSRAQVVQFHDPELMPVGLLLKCLGKKVVYDIHEDNAEDILTKDYLPWVARYPLSLTVRFLQALSARLFDGIICATPYIARRFPRPNTRVVQNFPPLRDDLSPVDSAEARSEFVFLGVLTERRGAKQMVEALRLANLRSPTTLKVLGFCSPASLERELSLLPGGSLVNFKGWTDRGTISPEMATAIAGLVLFHPGPNHTHSQPNKIFEYMACGVPFIASNFPSWKKLVEEVGCGICVDPLNPEEIAKAITWFQEHPEEARAMGAKGRKAVEQKYNWEREQQDYLGLITQSGQYTPQSQTSEVTA